MWIKCLALLAMVSLATMARTATVWACSGRAPATLSALPAGGATDVSPMTSIMLVTGTSTLPAGLTLRAGEQTLDTPAISSIGSGVAANKGATFWRLAGALSPSTTYTISAWDNGATRELTRFTTAASYDKTPGQAPVLSGLRLWRVHYPPEQAGSGNCVFSEYEGYIDLDYQDGTVPGTPAEEIVNVITLQAKSGGATQTFVFSGIGHFGGAQVEIPLANQLADVPDGGLPSPAFAMWKPTLEPDREYCATLTLYGRNDQAMPTVRSNTVCTAVMNMDGAGWDAGAQDGRGRDVNAEDASVVVVAPDGATGADTRYEDAIGPGGSTGLAGAGGAGAGGAGGAPTSTTTTGGAAGAGAGGATAVAPGSGGDKGTGGTSTASASGGVTGASGAGGASAPAGGKDAGSSTQAGRAQGCSCRLSARSEPSGWMLLAFVGLPFVRCLRRLRRSC